MKYYSYLCTINLPNNIMRNKIVFLIIAAIISSITAKAQNNNGLKYTKQDPLVYEDLWDMPPYSFMNEEGQPSGFNVDLVKEIMKRLNVPFVVKLKHTPLNFQDVANGTADLTIGMKAPYHDEYGAYGRNTIVLFTQSVAMSKNDQTEIHNFDDLKDKRIYVHRGSFSHNAMIDAGMEANAIPGDDMKALMLQIAAQDSGIVLWNTSALKELIQKNKLTNLKINAVSMKYGEYHFISRDTLLLVKMDSVYDEMVNNDEVMTLRKIWFYNEEDTESESAFVWYVTFVIGLFILVLISYNIYYRIKERRLNELNERQGKRLGLLLKSGKVTLWTYNVNKKIFNIINNEGTGKDEYNSKTFALFFPDPDFKQMTKAIERLENREEEQVKMMVTSNITTSNPDERLYFDLNISVLQQEEEGMPTTLIGIMHDITNEKKRFIDNRNNLLKYRTIFNTSMADLAYYDKDGILTDINKNACETFGITDRETLIKSKTHISEIPVFMGLKGDVLRELWVSSITDMDRLHVEKDSTKYWTRKGMVYYEFTIIPILDEKGETICFVSCGKDVTETAKQMNKERIRQKRIEQTSEQIQTYTKNINYALEVSGTRLANYDTNKHEMTIYNDLDNPLVTLSQIRSVELLAMENRHQVARLLINLDKKRLKKFDIRVKTMFKDPESQWAYYEFNGIPIKKNGKIDHYFCLCRNVSKLVATENQLEEETKRAQDAEQFQNSFLKNMSHEIRTPLYTVVGFAELFQNEHDKDDEPVFIEQIKQNSDKLLKLVNNILLLSRIDAKMVDTTTKTIDFPEFFKSKCMMGWTQGVADGVKTIIESNNDHLYVEIDENNVGMVIENLCRLAAIFTSKGHIKTRYIYHSSTMTIMVEDTGPGMSKETVEGLKHREMNNGDDGDYSISIQISICKELVELMGGTMECESEVGKGTTFWISIPCKIAEPPKPKPAAVTPAMSQADMESLLSGDIASMLSPEEAQALLSGDMSDLLSGDAAGLLSGETPLFK